MSVHDPYSEVMSGTSGLYMISHLDLTSEFPVTSVQGHSRRAAPSIEQATAQVQAVVAPQEEFGYAALPGVRQSPPVSGRL